MRLVYYPSPLCCYPFNKLFQQRMMQLNDFVNNHIHSHHRIYHQQQKISPAVLTREKPIMTSLPTYKSLFQLSISNVHAIQVT